MTEPLNSFDTSVWRELGDPLVAGAADGPLSGETVAVKDLYEIAGFAVGAGNPTFLAEAPVEVGTAPAVQQLLDAGAALRGIAQTDEFAYSIAGANPHYGPPPNPAVPGGLPGGSSSGPASAVALGEATIGLGTDTAGSIRVPASYQGLWGLRTTHGAVPLAGVWPLAPSFDTVGWLTRDAATLRRVVEVALGTVTVDPGGFVVDPGLVALAEPAVREAFTAALAGLDVEDVDLGDPTEMFEAFRVTQAAEAWDSDGGWVTGHPDAVGPGARERFALAAGVTREQEVDARAAAAAHYARLEELLGDRVLLVPSASSAAPSVEASAAELDAVRGATLRLTVVAGLTGRPGLSVPALSVPEPVGLCLVGPRGSDLALLDLAQLLLPTTAG
ncbi:amidase family protein [Pseudolysinimonas sp.]|jgi:amidase|uniref:amidase family protein n=1 Tax=Pseudolysinimonas sp. TaxID=2680009 RepID=UPI00378474E7